MVRVLQYSGFLLVSPFFFLRSPYIVLHYCKGVLPTSKKQFEVRTTCPGGLVQIVFRIVFKVGVLRQKVKQYVRLPSPCLYALTVGMTCPGCLAQIVYKVRVFCPNSGMTCPGCFAQIVFNVGVLFPFFECLAQFG